MLQLCRHLILQGYSADDITILTVYNGQMFYMKKVSRRKLNTMKQDSVFGIIKTKFLFHLNIFLYNIKINNRITPFIALFFRIISRRTLKS